MDLGWWGEDLGEKQRTRRAACPFIHHSSKAQLSVDCVGKTGICASKSVCPELPMNKVFMQKQVKKRQRPCKCVFSYGYSYFKLVVFHA